VLMRHTCCSHTRHTTALPGSISRACVSYALASQGTSADTLIKVAGPAAVPDPPLALQMPLPWERRFVVTAQ
jgi:hypothetical protein